MRFLCALIVFWAYRRMRYYQWRDIFFAINSYNREFNELNAIILVATKYGFPVGTLMCAIDNGKLPVDELFPEEMNALRQHNSTIAYFGKFGVLPFCQKMSIGRKIIRQAEQEAEERGINTAVILVNPDQVRLYGYLGFNEIKRSELSPNGLRDAPTVLLVHLPKI